ncbi:two pore domain potassium channel family protein [Rhodococcus sp. D2-41]|uniref:Potassium channel family protein n=1 Tax=Speluncibacter jeojiensis TaxID=2710754 RepID=A0A9X4RCS5_9ACTN|nr:potassium channel family protein [Rhodococcus sp. D2-41]MDG3011906.1 two pore domain potassium channel family protein [Rhodococcus sp. D2-41]MDG3013357.1 potassium channel family protein [Corynebacteriales bacterium D3-21]
MRDEVAERRARRRTLFGVLLRAAVSTTVLTALYFLLPLDGLVPLGPVGMTTVGLLVVVALMSWQVNRIMVSDRPVVRGAQALTVTVPLFILVFATVYYVLAAQSADSFGGPLTRVDALYFTVTVLATVGFGDITAHSQLARVLVTVQMLANLGMLAIGVKLLTAAARIGRDRRAAEARHPGEA